MSHARSIGATSRAHPVRHRATILWMLAALGIGGATQAQAAPLTIGCTSTPALFNTGYNVATDGILPNMSQDAHWEVTDIQPPVPNVSVPPAAGLAWYPAYVGNLVPGTWAATPNGKANWISREGPGGAGGGTSATGDWYYRYQFNLDPLVVPSSFGLQMNFLTDNSTAEVFVNGVAQTLAGVPQAGNLNGYSYNGFGSTTLASATTITQNWQAGLNTLVIRVQSGQPYEGFLAWIRDTPTCNATPQVASSVPTLDQWALALLALMVAGVAGIRRRS